MAHYVKAYASIVAGRGVTSAGTDQILKKEIVGDNDKQTIEDIFKKQATEEAVVAKGGGLTVNKTDGRNLPTTLLDLGKKIINPYSTFQPQDRSALFDILIQGLNKFDNKGQQQTVNDVMSGKLLMLKDFYSKYLDPIVTGGTVPTDDMTKDIGDQWGDMNQVLQHLTNGEYGAMPNAQKMVELAAAKKARMEAENKSRGGVIYAQNGTLVDYQPRGTDTVPAMLTPGEFVVNKASTQKNLPLLRAINNGAKNPKALSKGGIAYLEDGGLADLKQGFTDLGAYTPNGEEIEKGKAYALEIANKATKIAEGRIRSQKCRDEAGQQEKDKTATRLASLNSDEYKRSVSEAKQATMEALAKRNEIAIEIKKLQDGFVAQFKADLAKVKAETGLTSSKDIFAKFPRLAIEDEFTKPKGDIWSNIDVHNGDDLPAFQNRIAELVNRMTAYGQTAVIQDNRGEYYKNMFDIKPVPVTSVANRKFPAHAQPFERRDIPINRPPANSKARTKEQMTTKGLACKDDHEEPDTGNGTVGGPQTKGGRPAGMFQRGGMIYASQGTLVNYQPRGTDTVPAMLTPGEFVINKQATQRNLPLLKSINSHRYQTGGIVQPQYHDIGDMVSGASKAIGGMAGAVGIKLDTSKLETEINKALSDGAKMLSGVLQLSGQDRNALSSFGDNFKSLLSQMSQINIPPEIRFSMAPVSVNITGAQGLTDAAQGLIDGAIKKAFAGFLSVNDLQGTYKSP